jgi:hypothetical protein
MKVLVIVPTHDRTEFVAEAIASVMSQTRPADELVITGNIGPGIITDTDLGDRMNQAIENSDCDAFVMLGDDDTLCHGFLERTVAHMEQTGVDIVYTDCNVFGDRNCYGAALGEWTKENIDRNTVPLVTSLCTKSAWRRAGGYANVQLFDWDFWWRCFYSGATASWLRAPLWNYRRHPGQDSNTIDWGVTRDQVLARFDRLRADIELISV